MEIRLRSTAVKADISTLAVASLAYANLWTFQIGQYELQSSQATSL